MNRRQKVYSLLLAVVIGPLATPMPAQDPVTVYRVPVTGVIELGVAPYIERALHEAAEMGAVAVVLDIDTPGGRVDAAERISDALADSEVPVYALV
ncbi:MAG: nodulation protein NfeD, partial [Proteobacteria bacterium]|nr:nodulation protein NfeD [Pseudomonadota bacterium]